MRWTGGCIGCPHRRRRGRPPLPTVPPRRVLFPGSGPRFRAACPCSRGCATGPGAAVDRATSGLSRVPGDTAARRECGVRREWRPGSRAGDGVFVRGRSDRVQPGRSSGVARPDGRGCRGAPAESRRGPGWWDSGRTPDASARAGPTGRVRISLDRGIRDDHALTPRTPNGSLQLTGGLRKFSLRAHIGLKSARS